MKELGDILLNKFKWGPRFYEVNEELLKLYSSCKDSAEVVKSQQEYLDQLEESHQAARLLGTSSKYNTGLLSTVLQP